jgi:hypothetical protein
MAMSADALKAQIESDPRVRALAESRGPRGMVTAQELRSLFGYPAEDDWKYMNLNQRNTTSPAWGLSDPSSWATKAVQAGALGVMGLGGAGMLGVGPLAGSGAGAGAGAGTASAGAGLLPNLAQTLPASAYLSGAPSLTTGGGGFAGLMSGARNAGSSAWLDRILTGIKDYGPTALATTGAIKGLTQGPSEAEGQLNEILKMATGRVQASEPLFQSLMKMSTAQLPAYVREGINNGRN